MPDTSVGGNAEFKAISENILALVNQRFIEHSEWMQQWYNWTNSVMMQMQPIPPQAFMDFEMQSQRLMVFVMSFKPASVALKTQGFPQLATLIENTEEGAKKTQETFQAAQKSMATDDFKTRQKIMDMNKQTNQEILEMQRDTHQRQVESFDRSNRAFLNYLRS